MAKIWTIVGCLVFLDHGVVSEMTNVTAHHRMIGASEQVGLQARLKTVRRQ